MEIKIGELFQQLTILTKVSADKCQQILNEYKL
jgi:hypothetical protein